MNSVILWISTTSFLKYYKLLEVLHAAQPNLSKLNHMILDCVFALMRRKWSRRSWNTWKPAHPTRREHLNQLGLVYLKARWGASYGQQLFYLSTGTLPRKSINQIKGHKPSKPKHAKKMSRHSGWTCDKVQTCFLLSNHRCRFICMHISRHPLYPGNL